MDEKYFEQSSFRENLNQYDGNELATIENKEDSSLDAEINPRSGDFLWCKNYIINIKIYTINMYG